MYGFLERGSARHGETTPIRRQRVEDNAFHQEATLSELDTVAIARPLLLLMSIRGLTARREPV